MQSRLLRLVWGTLIVLVGLLTSLPAAHAQGGAQGYAPITRPAAPADQPPFGGGRPYTLFAPPPGSKSPAGYRLNTETVTATASEAVSGTLDSNPYTVRVRIRLGSDGLRQWQIDFFEPTGKDIAQVVVDDGSGEVVERWTGTQVETKLARGYQG